MPDGQVNSFTQLTDTLIAWAKQIGRDDAIALLEANLEHESLTPSSIEWRESLFALGELLYLEGAQQEMQSRLDRVADDQPTTRKEVIKHLEMSQKSFHDAIARLMKPWSGIRMLVK